MQLTVKIHLDNPLTLPISYHHIMQAILYNLMGDDEGNAELHDHGASYGKRQFKLFTYGPLTGKYEIRAGRITFFDSVEFEVRSYDENIILAIQKKLLDRGIRFGEFTYTDIETSVRNRTITEDSIKIKMKSPVCVYKTDLQTKFTIYFNPNDSMFEELIYDNFYRKYSSINELMVPPLLRIIPLNIEGKDKYITTYKNTVIEAYKGTYKLTGKPEHLNFLYNTGLGAKNSQGFGMFDIIEK